jgi:hypothetical protein
MNQVKLKKDFACVVDGVVVKFKKDEVLTLENKRYKAEDGRYILQETVQNFQTHFKFI